MTLHNIRIDLTSDAPAAKILADLGSKFADSSYSVKYDVQQVDIEQLLHAEIVDDDQAAADVEP